MESIEELKAQGFTDVVVATGAWMPGSAGLGEGAELDVLEFLEAAKRGEKLELARTSQSLAPATPPWTRPARLSAWLV